MIGTGSTPDIPIEHNKEMSVNHHKVSVTKTAHYSTYGELHKKTKYIWIACHGYGQLASRMIERFDFLDTSDHFVIAAEGLNRFYWHKNNKPVSAWMTSEDRYDEINDFVGYLDTLYQNYCLHVNQSQVKIVLFGFSQGCATLWRWIHASQPRFDYLINWAGWIPEDISYGHILEYLNASKLYLHYGNEDNFITEETVSKITDVISENQLEVAVSQFKGKHVIPKEELKAFVDSNILED